MPPTGDLPGTNNGKGVERLSIAALDKLIKKHQDKKNRRCAESPGEIAAKKEVREWMIANLDKLPKNPDTGERFYRYEIEDGVFADYTINETLKVKKVTADKEE